MGHEKVRSTMNLIREQYSGPMVATIGNHDYWSGGTLGGYQDNMNKISTIFAEQGVHYIDERGIYIHPAFPDVKILGVSGWYSNPNPPTNDGYHLPRDIEGISAHAFILNRSERILQEQMDELDKSYDSESDTVVFMSHFPVIKPKKGPGDYKGAFEDFCWSERVSTHLNAAYGCKYFLNGHAHQLHTGEEMRYEPGADYHNPAYKIWSII